MNGLTALVGQLHGKFVKKRQVHRIVDYLAVHVPAGGTVLDVGCGSGELAYLLMQRIPGLKIIGADVFVRTSVAIPVTDFDGLHLPFADQSFDSVMVIDVIHHADNQQQILREIARVANGPILIKDHLAYNNIDRAILAFMDWVGNRSYGVRLPYNYLSPDQWALLFTGAGIAEAMAIPVRKLYPFPFSLLFERHLQVLYTARPQHSGSAT